MLECPSYVLHFPFLYLPLLTLWLQIALRSVIFSVDGAGWSSEQDQGAAVCDRQIDRGDRQIDRGCGRPESTDWEPVQGEVKCCEGEVQGTG